MKETELFHALFGGPHPFSSRLASEKTNKSTRGEYIKQGCACKKLKPRAAKLEPDITAFILLFCSERIELTHARDKICFDALHI